MTTDGIHRKALRVAHANRNPTVEVRRYVYLVDVEKLTCVYRRFLCVDR